MPFFYKIQEKKNKEREKRKKEEKKKEPTQSAKSFSGFRNEGGGRKTHTHIKEQFVRARCDESTMRVCVCVCVCVCARVCAPVVVVLARPLKEDLFILFFYPESCLFAGDFSIFDSKKRRRFIKKVKKRGG